MNNNEFIDNTPASHELGNIGSSINNMTTNDSNTGSSWATSVSQYLLRRRRQTHLAYQSQLRINDVEDQSNTQDWLFESLFELLVQRLEEGHTVVTLSSMSNLDHTWRWHLIQPLFQPLLNYAQSTLAQNVDTQSLMSNDHALWKDVLLQSTLSQYDQQRLQQRYTVATQLYNYLQSTKNSLSKFVIRLEGSSLIQKMNKKDTAETTPIIFVRKENKDNLTLTLWLHRTWKAEYNLAHHVIRIKSQVVQALPITANSQLNPEQQKAIYMANRSAFSIITGGPGTGKTFTVAQLVIALQQVNSDKEMLGAAGETSTSINLALAAPTGKAAQRMQESLQDAIGCAGIDIQLPEAKTIHRLLGIGQGGRPRYNQDNPLSEDIIIVDEASMLGVELANYLVSAVKPKARLILLGDANQLAAVDAGAVLADLCRIPALQSVHKRLESSRRFTAESGIGKLAKLINQDVSDIERSTDEYGSNVEKSMEAVWQLMEDDETLDFYHLAQSPSAQSQDNVVAKKYKVKNSLSSQKFYSRVLKYYNAYISRTAGDLDKVRIAKSMPTAEYIAIFNELIAQLNQFRVLTAGHHGRCGDYSINRYLSEQHRNQLKLPLSKSPWYHGRPIMVLQNNYELGLFNGDIGICLQIEGGRLQVFFENKKTGISVNMLGDEMIATSYAMTIHKSQGSEFEHVAICFDDSNARLLSQELIYTAVTRAKKRVSLFTTKSAFTQALATPTVRQTGLSLQFEDMGRADESS
ncbi:exodeoxyribonuclease V subunit alpha [Psychrobacter sp. DM4]|uniref:exodeoxyribonuclease V subunit alpha n=1 Tax=Psychrobacter sp. DM4 TaxID=3440637 RepID=UPI003F500A6B